VASLLGITLVPSGGLTTAVCAAFGVSRSCVHRHRTRRDAPATVTRRRPRSPRALDPQERQAALDLLRELGFVDLAPAEVHATLLDEGVYHCSIRTMYRLLIRVVVSEGSPLFQGNSTLGLRRALRANECETPAPLKFRLEGVGNSLHGHAQ
jgi:hypothetical protein